MKAILISIKPQWVGKILNGEKTVEIRKSIPKCKLPCKVYIYCSKTKPYLYRLDDDNNFELTNNLRFEDDGFVKDYNAQNGKVIAEFTLKNIVKFDIESLIFMGKHKELMQKSCLGGESLRKYIGNKISYSWGIDNLKIYDKPFPVRAFTRCDYYDSRYEGCCDNCHHAHISYPEWVETREDLYDCEITATCCNHLKKAPQSWCYVEELQ